ncbi:hypothetical protein EXVG_00315 [Emiliania huxleyi virus 202]|nr:hypothetical protein EXVG_00315 [Emiliania huxleyi virus 202]AHA54236.1 hypothetical protein EhV18_00189 [Emiliania huxleyi virus 18]AHA55284.1 hypothetical protein EhV156_00188 [Emiliania huxleyi virus 156]
MAVPLSRAEGMKVRNASDPPLAVAKTAKELKVEQKAAKKAAKAAKKDQKKKNAETRKAAKAAKAAKKSKNTEREPSKRFTTKNVTNLPKDVRTANPQVKLGQRKESGPKNPLHILGI